ncbi:MAG: hypothetical protein GY913_23775 [Proteobacteria bacterium]|nr:hypothetical protein [Pseudomonadota bacterium]MCP4919934.1 hypothetical protein [Pseudomonadota bacterium]
MSLFLLLAAPSFAQDGEEVVREPIDPTLLELVPTWTIPVEEPEVEVVATPDGEPTKLRETLIAVPGVELEVRVPAPPDETGVQPWQWTINDTTMDTRLGMANREAYTYLRFGATDYQPDLTKLGDEIIEQLLPMDDEELEISPGELQRFEHEALGDVIVLNAHIWDSWMERDLWSQTIVFNVEGSAIMLTSQSSDTLVQADVILGEVIDMLSVVEPPIAEDDLPYGVLDTPAGYTIELPMGWRALTEDEAPDSTRIAGDGPFAGNLSQIFVVDPASLSKPVFECVANAGSPLEVLAPAKSTEAIENFKTAMRVQLKGGKYRLESAGDEIFIDADTSIPLYTTTEGEVEFLPLGERDAYRWRVEGTVFEEPVAASVFYTAYSDIGLVCTSVVEQGDEALLGTFDSSVDKLRITDDAAHVMPLSLASKYKRWWPMSNPLLQLYWLPVPLFLIAGWLVVRDD